VMRIDAPESANPIALDDFLRAKEELPRMVRSLVEGAAEGSNAFFLPILLMHIPFLLSR
jgi:hypothetical protein